MEEKIRGIQVSGKRNFTNSWIRNATIGFRDRKANMGKTLAANLRPASILTLLISINITSFVETAADEAFQPNIKPTISIPRTTGAIKIDGMIDDVEWRDAACAANFCEYNPGEKVRPPVATEVLIAYDDANFYLAFKAYDDPKSVRVSIVDRDNAWQDDNVGIIFDTYGDAAWAYEIFCNAAGIQGDVLWRSGDEDTGFDLVFYSAGAVTDSGYQVEMAIPFKSLRFPNKPSQTWRATFWRNHPRGSRGQYTWAAVDRNVSCFPCQFGTLTGIENVKPGRELALLPSITGFQTAAIRDGDDPNSGLAYDDIDGRISLGARYSLSSSSTVEATYKPDFSQVESDAAEIDINSTFALFYPERRPFFQEGSDLFSTWIRTVYTRSINDPLFAAKFVGRMNRTNFAVLGARDEASPIVVPLEEQGAVVLGGRSTSTIVRVKQTYLDDSFVGGLVTTRSLDGGGSGSLGGIDGRHRIFEKYAIWYQGLVSRTEEPNDTILTQDIEQRFFEGEKHTVAFDNESYWGHGGYLGFSRDARHWNVSIDYTDKNPTFRTDNGFVTQNDRRELSIWQGYNFYPERKWATRIMPSLMIGRVWNYDGLRKDEWLRPEFFGVFAYQTEIYVAYLWSRENFRGYYFPGIRRVELEINSKFSDPVTLGMWFSAGRTIARNLDIPVLGKSIELDLWGTLKPLSNFLISPQFSYARMRHPDGSEIFAGYILRTKFNYQFTRELMARLVIQYDDFDSHFDLEPLLSYKLNPFTIFYIGSTHAYREFVGYDGLTQTEQQFFLKFQYLVGL